MNFTEPVGLLAATFTTLAYLPQVVRTWRTRSAHDFSLSTLLMLVMGVGLWVIYGLLHAAPAIWIGNGITTLLAGSILGMKLCRG